jgi:HAD superfamily hydrolase (TIGR01509 family)
MTRAILFDFNGVIVDDEPQHCEALIATLATYGFPLSREEYYQDYLGFDDRECFRFSFGKMGRALAPATLAEAIERKAERYDRAIRASLTLVPGSAAFINRAAADGYRLAVVSGALQREIDLVLGLSGLRTHFELVVAAEDVGACKPSPEGYERARQALGVEAGACMVIEDSLPGLAAARGAGLRCAMISTSLPASALAGADLVWPTLEQRTPDQLPWKDDRWSA